MSDIAEAATHRYIQILSPLNLLCSRFIHKPLRMHVDLHAELSEVLLFHELLNTPICHPVQINAAYQYHMRHVSVGITQANRDGRTVCLLVPRTALSRSQPRPG